MVVHRPLTVKGQVANMPNTDAYEKALNAERNTLRLIKRKLEDLTPDAAQRIAEWVTTNYSPKTASEPAVAAVVE